MAPTESDATRSDATRSDATRSDATRLLLAELRLSMRQDSLLRIVLDSVAQGIIATDARGHVIYCNPAMGQMLGYHPDELLDQYVGLVVSPADREAHSKGFHNFVGRLQEDEISQTGTPSGQALTKSGELVTIKSRVYGAFSGGEVVVIGFFEKVEGGSYV